MIITGQERYIFIDLSYVRLIFISILKWVNLFK